MSRTERFRHSLVFITAVTAVLAWAPIAQAEDAAKGRAIWEKGECSVCHGWSGDGVGTADHGAPSLRLRHLSHAKIREIIQCGRGADMPYFDRFAYTDKRCSDATARQAGKEMPDRSPVTLQPFEIDPLADYVAAKIMGAGKVTRGECFEFFGGAGSQCDKYPER
jgi:hypothetical protein